MRLHSPQLPNNELSTYRLRGVSEHLSLATRPDPPHPTGQRPPDRRCLLQDARCAGQSRISSNTYRPRGFPTPGESSKWATKWATQSVQTHTNHRASDDSCDPSHQAGKHGTGRKRKKSRMGLRNRRSQVRILSGASKNFLQKVTYCLAGRCDDRVFGQQGGHVGRALRQVLAPPRANGYPLKLAAFSFLESDPGPRRHRHNNSTRPRPTSPSTRERTSGRLY